MTEAPNTTLVETVRSRRKAWTAPELADLLNLSTKYIYSLVKQGRLPAYHIGTSVRFDPKATADWLGRTI